MAGDVPEELFEFRETLNVVKFLDEQVRTGYGVDGLLWVWRNGETAEHSSDPVWLIELEGERAAGATRVCLQFAATIVFFL